MVLQNYTQQGIEKDGANDVQFVHLGLIHTLITTKKLLWLSSLLLLLLLHIIYYFISFVISKSSDGHEEK